MKNIIYLVMLTCEIGTLTTGRLIMGIFSDMIQAESCKTRLMKRTGSEMRPCSFSLLSDGRCEFKSEDGGSKRVIEIQKHMIGEDLSEIEL